MADAALFIRRDTALKAGITHAKRCGVPTHVILAKTKVYPVVKRGELKGYQCRYPVTTNVTDLVKEA